MTFDLSKCRLGDEEGMVTERAHHSPPTFGVFFPSCVCTTIVHLVALLDDSEVNKEGVAGLLALFTPLNFMFFC